MESVKISSKGRIVIPKSLRELHRIHAGDSFIITAVEELRFKPVPTTGKSNLKAVAGMLHRPGGKKLSETQLARRVAAHLRNKDKASKDGCRRH
jgi:AbrB family looped-hinge helix DNA binding protein